ncbi:hypothetical protein HOE67_00705 [Candidatus Peregrinibacteria bacterium]|jgi:hypothetical protein|nr:hypothetical protein [Candidatus Peregrinibacteria bacterium]MBT4055609.1 hypothetical protein [Candidatus Peregrinibacteria bacterium]
MVEISQEKLEEFKKIWQKEYGEDISDEKAREYGGRLVNLFKVLIEIDRKK